MKHESLKYYCLLLCIGICSIAWGVEVPLSGERAYTISSGRTLVVTDSRSGTGACDGALIVKSEDQSVMYISGTYTFNDENEYVDIFDGENSNGRYIGHYDNDGTFSEICCYTGSIYIHFSSEDKSSSDCFNLTIRQCQKSSKVFNIDKYMYDENHTMITWEDTSGTNRWRVVYGDLSGFVSYYEEETSAPLVLLPSDNCEAVYYCRIFDADDNLDCGSEMYCFEGYKGITVCNNFTDLYSCNVVGTSGRYHDPFQQVGIVNHGSLSQRSCHTVHTDTIENDYRTCFNLSTVPDNEIVSVRIGNWGVDARAESLTYLYEVDTSINDLLIMKYAVVMQDPNHPPDKQPKFEFKILDEDGEEIDSVCYSRKYVASDSLGWHSVNEGGINGITLWKDWSTIGIPLDELHGQQIRLQFVTYDCSEGGHFGYAYLNLKCSNKTITTSACGESIANTFMAPDGFKYKWYKVGNEEQILSVDRTLSVTESGTYKCRMTMIDVPEGSCEVELTATATIRYPHARFLSEVMGHECERVISFRERSQIATNAEYTNFLDEPCDHIFWDFGDGEMSSERNPVHQYAQNGVYEVTMVATLADGICTDTIRKMVEVGLDCTTEVINDTICGGDTYIFYDRELGTSGRYVHVTDTMTTLLFLEVVPNTSVSRFDTVVENDLPYRYREHVFDTIIEDSMLVYPRNDGCDSLIHYNLMVYYNENTYSKQVICDSELPYSSAGEMFDSAGVYVQYLQTIHGADSIATLDLRVNPAYDILIKDTICAGNVYNFGLHEYERAGVYVDSFYTNLGCDSVITLKLEVLENKHTVDQLRLCRGMSLTWQDGNIYDSPTTEPTMVFNASNGCDSVVQLVLDTSILDARCNVSPIYVTSQNPIVELTDMSIGNDRRIWYLPNMSSEEERWSYTYPMIEDSIKILLVAIDDMNCVDSTFEWVYMTDAQIWIPNVFTPGEESNNIFRAVHKDLLDIEVMIFDRRGQFIYSYNTLDGGWNGTMNGVDCPQAAYVYKIRYHTKSYPKQVKTIVGTVMLLR